ncbi:MAG: stage II sporulation protein M [Armatimonadota bacterium]
MSSVSSPLTDIITKYTTLLTRLEQSNSTGVSGDDAIEFSRLYHLLATELSVAKANQAAATEIERLNRLVGRGYAVAYRNQPVKRFKLKEFFTRELPQSLIRARWFLLLSTLITVGMALFAAINVSIDPSTATNLMGSGADQAIESLAERHSGNKNWAPSEERPFLSSYVTANNLQVSFLAYAGGIAFGLFTVVILVVNGLMLGTIAAGLAHHPHAVIMSFWGFVAPHGVFEIPAIIIAGAAGLQLGWALICPAPYSRADSLQLAGSNSIRLIICAMFMLLIAGFIEGHISPIPMDPRIKLSLAAVESLISILITVWLFTRSKAALAVSGTHTD